MELLTEENNALRGEVQRRGDRFDGEKYRVQVRILDRELKLKQEEMQKMEKTMLSQQHETRFLREELTKLESEMTDLRKDYSQSERENSNLRTETQRLNAENNRLITRLRDFSDIPTCEIHPRDYLALQQRLEDTTLRIKSLEEQVIQTSENCEELRQHASITIRRAKPRCDHHRTSPHRERPRSRNSVKAVGNDARTQREGSKGNKGRRRTPL